ncbi:MAG: amidase domain-containing protein [Clostridium sp.]|nr:amidase domain-containing protein [Clostridium sp.]
MPYDRKAAVRYAHEWVYRRNPRYYDFSELGGDCTSFVSQALYAGGIPMDVRPDGWYYNSPDDRAPAWSSVSRFYDYGVRPKPWGMTLREVPLSELEEGDVIQLSFADGVWGHTLLVVFIGKPAAAQGIYLAAHSNDNDFRPLDTYTQALSRRALKVGLA